MIKINRLIVRVQWGRSDKGHGAMGPIQNNMLMVVVIANDFDVDIMC